MAVRPLALGVWGVLATPLTPDASGIDTTSLERQVQHYVRIGATGLTVLGVFGEAARLTPDERRSVVRTVAAAAHELPLVIGLSALDTDAACAEAANVLDVLDRPPAGLMVQVGSPDPDALARQLGTVVERTGQGVVVQGYPVVSEVRIDTRVLVEHLRRTPHTLLEEIRP